MSRVRSRFALIGLSGAAIVTGCGAGQGVSTRGAVPSSDATAAAARTTGALTWTDLPDTGFASDGIARMSLSTTGTGPGGEELDHVDAIERTSTGLLAVGSKTYGLTSQMAAIWTMEVGPTGSVTTGAPYPLGFGTATTPEWSRSTVRDLSELDDGTLLVLGTRHASAEPTAVLWSMPAPNMPAELVTLPSVLEAGEGEQVLLDRSGRPWVVTSRDTLDGSISVGVGADDGWHTAGPTPAGFVSKLFAVPSADGIVVIAHGEASIDGAVSTGWHTRRYGLAGDVVVESVTALGPGFSGLVDVGADRQGIFALVDTPSGPELRRSSDGVQWSVEYVRDDPDRWGVAAVATAAEPIILLSGDPEPGSPYEIETVQRTGLGSYDQWGSPFLVETLATGSRARLAAQWDGDQLHVLDPGWSDPPVWLTLRPRLTAPSDPITESEPGFAAREPSVLERVVKLLPTDRGAVAVVTRMESAGVLQWQFIGTRVVELRDGEWSDVDVGHDVIAATTWRGAPLLATLHDGDVEWVTVSDGRPTTLGTTEGLTSIAWLTATDDRLVVANGTDGPTELSIGTPDTGFATAGDLGPGAAIGAVCAEGDDVYAVVRRIGAPAELVGVGDRSIDEIAELPEMAPDTGQRCWASGGIVSVMFERPLPPRSTEPVYWRIDPAVGAASRWTGALTPEQPHSGAIETAVIGDAAGVDGTQVAGLGFDRWGGRDGVVWSAWGDAVPRRTWTVGGPGRQEVRALLLPAPGGADGAPVALFGGTDDGQAIVWAADAAVLAGP